MQMTYYNFSCDTLTIYDGGSNSSFVIGQYSGTSIPPNHISSRNEITIWFQSDVSVTRNGFKLEYNPQ